MLLLLRIGLTSPNHNSPVLLLQRKSILGSPLPSIAKNNAFDQLIIFSLCSDVNSPGLYSLLKPNKPLSSEKLQTFPPFIPFPLPPDKAALTHECPTFSYSSRSPGFSAQFLPVFLSHPGAPYRIPAIFQNDPSVFNSTVLCYFSQRFLRY